MTFERYKPVPESYEPAPNRKIRIKATNPYKKLKIRIGSKIRTNIRMFGNTARVLEKGTDAVKIVRYHLAKNHGTDLKQDNVSCTLAIHPTQYLRVVVHQ